MFFDQVFDIGPAQHFDKADLLSLVEIDNQESLRGIQFNYRVDLNLCRSCEAGAVIVAAVTNRQDPETTQLLFERFSASALQQEHHFFDEIRQNLTDKR